MEFGEVSKCAKLLQERRVDPRSFSLDSVYTSPGHWGIWSRNSARDSHCSSLSTCGEEKLELEKKPPLKEEGCTELVMEKQRQRGHCKGRDTDREGLMN